jgi:hypothetical protein
MFMEWVRRNRYNWYSYGSSPYFIRIKRMKKKKSKKGKVYIWTLHNIRQNVAITMGAHASVPWAKEAAVIALLETKLLE